MEKSTLQHLKERTAQGENIGDIVREHGHKYSREDLIILIVELDYVARWEEYTDTEGYNKTVIKCIEEYNGTP